MHTEKVMKVIEFLHSNHLLFFYLACQRKLKKIIINHKLDCQCTNQIKRFHCIAKKIHGYTYCHGYQTFELIR